MCDNLWEDLGKPRYVVAPMVEGSELAWRLLGRRKGAHLCYTPMLHSSVFIKDSKYRKEGLQTCLEDRPLIVQFCGNNPEVVVEAAKMAQHMCDAIDINLGCPQAIAKRGHYGAFLQDDWDLISSIVKRLSEELNIPVTCKIRVFEDIDRTIRYAKMLEASGCKMLTVHGRTREQKGPLTGIASWVHIKAVRDNVNIPILANGNVQYLFDVERCILETGVNGVMSAEGNLHNPSIFQGVSPPMWESALEYIDLVCQYPCPPSFVRGHIFKMFHSLLSLEENKEERDEFAKTTSIEDFRATVIKLKEKYLPYHEGLKPWYPSNIEDYNLTLPPWLCQPYVRMSPEDHIKKMADKQREAAERQQSINCGKENENSNKRHLDEPQLSKNQFKKLKKNPSGKLREKRHFDKCSACPNPVGSKCVFVFCKACCRNKCMSENVECAGHRIRRKPNNKQNDKVNET